MSASLVGSEMCIRDRPPGNPPLGASDAPDAPAALWFLGSDFKILALPGGCLLYTSDAADDM
eukprot:3713694-Alexandrium_andersonii.AAC.1